MAEKASKTAMPIHEATPPLGHTPPNPIVSSGASGSRRDRSTSLSIARSPSVLSSAFGTSPISGIMDPLNPQSHAYHTSLSIPPPKSVNISYSNSNAIHSKSLALNRTRTLPPSTQTSPDGNGKSLHRTSTLPTTLREEDEARERYTNGLVHTLDSDEDEEEYLSREDDETFIGREYGGSFQKPDKKELVWMLSSLGGVLLISIAAGLTTVFDWVF